MCLPGCVSWPIKLGTLKRLEYELVGTYDSIILNKGLSGSADRHERQGSSNNHIVKAPLVLDFISSYIWEVLLGSCELE